MAEPHGDIRRRDTPQMSPPRGRGEWSLAPASRQRRKQDRRRQKARQRERRKRTPLSTLTCVTQNVRGLAKDENNRSNWFSGFRQRQHGGAIDVVFLQETRATTDWVPKLRDQHAREWGFRPEQLVSPLSYWQSTPSAAGGVAILLNPNSKLAAVKPLWQEEWSPWFMAIQAQSHGETVTFVNVYGPSNTRRAREDLYTRLQRLPRQPGLMVLGGDFNCTLDAEMDRSRTAAQSHDSPALHDLVDAWALGDALQTTMEQVITDADKREFHAAHHTYRYAWRDGELASSRLDRWYVSSQWLTRIQELRVCTPANDSDHDAVRLEFAVSHGRSVRDGKRRRPRLRYPIPHGCQQVVIDTSYEALDEFELATATASAAWSAQAWTQCKDKIRHRSLVGIRQVQHRQRRGDRRRSQRLNRALRVALTAPQRTRRSCGGLDEITEAMDDLTLDHHATVVSLRKAIIRLDKKRAARRRRHRFTIYAAGAPASERAFFRRFSTRQGHTPVQLLCDDNNPMGTAERLAHDWKQVTQRGATAATARAAFFSQLPTVTPCADLAVLDDCFTEEEVRAAIRACPRGKAAGPDGIPNDWYCDHIDRLVPVLTPLYNAWHRQRTLPSTFRQATFACIPKTTTPKTGMDFRPIALLDTDYKIYSRLLLNRVRSHLPRLVATTQYGFVEGRQVHDALDVFHATQRLVRQGDAPADALAVLLDFAKAYDTLDRDFLLQALERLGFPPAFCGAVRHMHLLTTAEYAADDTISDPQNILNGIRQGCPLAPTLFVLAVNTLNSKVTGFADDTTVYLVGAAATVALRARLQDFETAAGLCINPAKCVVVALGGDHTPTSAEVGFPVAAHSYPSRLLGGQVATRDIEQATWELTLQQIRTRLHMAQLKTTNVLQRVKLLRAILLPKFLFIARHHWPTAGTIRKFQRLVDHYAWAGSLVAEPPRRRAWASTHVAHSAVGDGGLAIPQLTHELQANSVGVVARWARPAAGISSTIGHILLGNTTASTTATVTRTAVAHPDLQATLAATGLQVRQALAVERRDDAEQALVLRLLKLVGRGTTADFDWRDGWLQVDYTRLGADHHELRRLHEDRCGNVHVDALLQARITGVLLNQDGNSVRTRDFPKVFRAGNSLGEVMRIGWSNSGIIQFQPVDSCVTTDPVAARNFRRLCDTLVCQYPGLLRVPGQSNDLVLRPASLDVWRLQPAQPTGYTLEWNPVDNLRLNLGPVDSTANATAKARRALRDHTVHFELHEWLDRPFSLWHGTPTPTATRARALLKVPTQVRCQREQKARLKRWTASDPVIAAALNTVTWRQIMELPGITAAQRLLFYRLKGDRLSRWDRLNERVGCPHCSSIAGVGGMAAHVFWDCPVAQLLWRQLRDAWQSVWTTVPPMDRSSIFSLTLSPFPDRLWSHTALQHLGVPTLRDTVSTQLAVQAVWCGQVLATLDTIWRWRTQADASTPLWTEAHGTAYHFARLRAVFVGLQWHRRPNSAATAYTAAALALVGVPVEHPTVALPRVLNSADAHYLLFFDGGSRGNPGPGGSGAVVLRVSSDATTATLVWTAAMSSAHATTTNNQAEYGGLLVGLKAAAAHQWRPLQVIGDSMLILNQMRSYRPPKNERLCALYAQTRRLADSLGVCLWHHHLRAFNCMADAAANAAMDDQTSSQVHHPTTRSAHAGLGTHLQSDFAHWQARHFAAQV